MKFFHVYNDECYEGLVKNNLLNRDSGLKLQHCFAVPKDKLFNNYAKVGGKLHSLIKENNIPFYVDRIAGGVIYYPYTFDKQLIAEYQQLLGDWFLGFQMHESASNRRGHEWRGILRAMGSKGPYDAEELRRKLMSNNRFTPDGKALVRMTHDTPEYFATRTYAETVPDFVEEVKDMYRRRLSDTANSVLPCDSHYLLSKLQSEMGMKTFMPEVGCQIPMMRIAISLARGTAKADKKTWGAYYECWRHLPDLSGYCMPCYNQHPINEWYLTQESHGDDFTTYGENGGSSRLLQNRIYHYALMSGADYISEEWGLNCSYTDMEDFTLSKYGIVKKNFIHTAEKLRGIQAVVPFAIVLPKKYICVELPSVRILDTYKIGIHRNEYMRTPLSAEEQDYFGHIEDVLKLIFGRVAEQADSEAHVLTNSRMGDLFDIIYEDAGEEVFAQYEYLIDATKEGTFANSAAGKKFKTLESADLEALEQQLYKLAPQVMPCYVDGLHWLVSVDEKGQKYLTIFNNEGNERLLDRGDVIDHQMDKWVNVTFKQDAQLKVVTSSDDQIEIQKSGSNAYRVLVPATGFVILAF